MGEFGHSNNSMNFFHGGSSAIFTINPDCRAEDGELLCASASVNVARRYGDMVSMFSLTNAPVKRMKLGEWMSQDTDLVSSLREEGFSAVIVEGANNSFDFPVETIFVLSPDALQFVRPLSAEEIAELDDGLPFKEPK